jgi:hypothetical protein
MTTKKRPHYVIKPSEIAEWLDREPGTWWIVHGDSRLTGIVDFPCPSGELSEALRRYQNDLLIYAPKPISTGSKPSGQAIKSQGLNDLSDRDNPEKSRTFFFSWSDREDDWMLAEYPTSRLREVQP